MITQIKIYDMDGTIVDSSHRYRANKDAIDLKYWLDNLHKIQEDALLPLAEAYKADLKNKSIYVIIATARACIENDENYAYIRKNLGMPNMFVHRGMHDDRKGAKLKIAAIKPLLNLRQFKGVPVHVFEDNISYLEEMCGELNAYRHFVKKLPRTLKNCLTQLLYFDILALRTEGLPVSLLTGSRNR